MHPRLISPHPYTNQPIVALARGPIVYCVEDIDNAWVTDHFKTVQLDPSCSITENEVQDESTGDKYIGLTVEKDASIMEVEEKAFNPGMDAGVLTEKLGEAQKNNGIDKLVFVPYFFRGNRGGKGMSRVGLRRWVR